MALKAGCVATALFTTGAFRLSCLGQYVIYGGMLSGFALLALMPLGRARECAR
ncbi:MAG: hypothetical protein ACLPX9_08710 [Rhodomicrobium sp.]